MATDTASTTSSNPVTVPGPVLASDSIVAKFLNTPIHVDWTPDQLGNISAMMSCFLNSETEKAIARSLPNDMVHQLYRVFKKILLDGCKDDQAMHSNTFHIRRQIAKLGQAAQFFPPELVLQGLEVNSSYQVQGGGGCADVRQGRYCGRMVAVKTLRVFEDQHGKDKIAEIKADFYREAHMSALVSHARVLPLLGVEFSGGLQPCLITHWMVKGDLNQYQHRVGIKDVSKKMLLTFLRQVAEGIAYLHGDDCHIIHGDIKPSNILINDDLEAVITDYGVSVWIDATAGIHSNRNAADFTRQAPEMLTASAPLSFKTDIYMFGHLILDAFTVSHPYPYEESSTVRIFTACQGIAPDMIKVQEFLKLIERTVSPVVQDLVKACWSRTPHERPSIHNVHSDLMDIVGDMN